MTAEGYGREEDGIERNAEGGRRLSVIGETVTCGEVVGELEVEGVAGGPEVVGAEDQPGAEPQREAGDRECYRAIALIRANRPSGA